MTKLAIVLIAVATIGCDDDDTNVVVVPPGGVDAGQLPSNTLEWRATLSPTDIYSSLRGDAVVRMTIGEAAFMASATVRNDVSGALRPWHVHIGNCAARGAIVGDDASYPRLAVDGAGAASSSVLIRVGLDATAAYSVNVHQSDAQFNTIIACGELILQ
jgi:hypothetical protein